MISKKYSEYLERMKQAMSFCSIVISQTLTYFIVNTGCITADELKFVLTHLPGKVTYKEIDEMIKTVDENGDGKINYQEFRVMIGAKPNLTASMTATNPDKQNTNKKATSGNTSTNATKVS